MAHLLNVPCGRAISGASTLCHIRHPLPDNTPKHPNDIQRDRQIVPCDQLQSACEPYALGTAINFQRVPMLICHTTLRLCNRYSPLWSAQPNPKCINNRWLRYVELLYTQGQSDIAAVRRTDGRTPHTSQRMNHTHALVPCVAGQCQHYLSHLSARAVWLSNSAWLAEDHRSGTELWCL